VLPLVGLLFVLYLLSSKIMRDIFAEQQVKST